jgi:LCP family protein required for cell wall assembly
VNIQEGRDDQAGITAEIGNGNSDGNSVGSDNGNVDGNAVGRGNRKKTPPTRTFAKVFAITFLCCIVGITVGLSAIDSLLAKKPMSKSGSEVQALQPAGQTEDNLNLLIPAEGVFKTDPDFRNTRRVNVLLFGNTINSSKTKGLTDTIMLGSFDPKSKNFDVISIPRDTYYKRDGYSGAAWLKINSVMESDGVKAACESVHNILQGVHINYYAVINYDGVAKIVDAMNGVPIDVPFNMYYTDKKQELYINLKAGKQTLDGKHAIQFLRYRKGYTEGDLGRVDAQQTFVRAAVKKALGLNLPKVAKTVVDNVDSDMDIRAMLYLVSNASGVTSENIKSHLLPGASSRISGLSFWVPADSEKVVDMMREVYTGVPKTTAGAITPGAAKRPDSGTEGRSAE